MSSVVPTIAPLTSLRFFAALHVLLLHNLYLSGAVLPELISRFVSVGHTAVTLFFILSGFLLTHVYSGSDEESFPTHLFWIKRFARIYPLFIVGFILDAPRVIGFFINASGTVIGLVKTVIVAVLNVFMVQAWVPQVVSSWNAPAWSLSAEMFFYALFPFLILKTKNISIFNFFKFLFGLLIVTLVVYVPFVYFYPGIHFVTDSFFSVAMMNPAFHLLEFVWGVFLARWLNEQSALSCSRVFLFKWGGVLGVAGVVAMSYFSVFLPHVILHLFFIPFFSIIILSLAFPGGFLNSFLSWRPLVFLGNSSYAIYILHQPLKNYVFYVMGDVPSWSLFLSYLGFVFGVSLLAYIFIEETLRKKIVSWYRIRYVE